MDEEYLAAVLDVVADIPAGRVMTYGGIAEVVREHLGRGGPRQVGAAMALAGGAVPWWRVVAASGAPPMRLRRDALARLRAEGCPVSGTDETARVRLRAAVWWPAPDLG